MMMGGTDDRPLGVQVVHEGRHRIGVVDGTFRQVNRAETDNTINTIESRCGGGGAEGLLRYSQASV
jgi:hypothetical protein